MSQQIKALVLNPDDLSSISGTLCGRRRELTSRSKLSSDHLCDVCHAVCFCMWTNTCTVDKCNYYFFKVKLGGGCRNMTQWLSVQFLFQRTWVQFPSPIWQLTTAYNSSSKREWSDILLVLLYTGQIYRQTHVTKTHI